MKKSKDALGKIALILNEDRMFENENELTADAQSRIEDALIATYIGTTPEARLILSVILNPNNNLNAEKRAMAMIAGRLAKLSQSRGEYDLRDHMADALARYVAWTKDNELRRKELDIPVSQYKFTDIDTYVAQEDMFTPQDTVSDDIVRIFAAGRKAMTYKETKKNNNTEQGEKQEETKGETAETETATEQTKEETKVEATQDGAERAVKIIYAALEKYAQTAELQPDAAGDLLGAKPKGKAEIIRHAVETAKETARKLTGSAYSVSADKAIADALNGVTRENLRTGIEQMIDGGTLAMRLKEGDRERIINGAVRFFDAYAQKKITLSTGAYLYFVPSAQAVERLKDTTAAWAEYAIHAVTNDVTKDGKHYRAYSEKKDALINSMIEEIIAEDKAIIAQNGYVNFYKQLDKKHIATIIARPVESGNYEADLVEATATYKNGKIPNNVMPLVGVPGVNTSVSGTSFTPTDEDSISQTAAAVNGDFRASVVYHGSAADFEKFDHSFMGSGEGNQAYGWGTYVSEVNGIARAYAQTAWDNRLGERVTDEMIELERVRNLHRKNARMTYDVFVDKCNRMIPELKEKIKGNEKQAQRTDDINQETRDAYKGYAEKARKELKRWVPSYEGYQTYINEENQLANEAREELKKEMERAGLDISETPRHLYIVNIPDDTGDNYLHWEKPIPASLAKKLKENPTTRDLQFAPNETGSGVYFILKTKLGSKKEASLFLSSLGITGVSMPTNYNTHGTRDKTRNYVIFKEEDAQIIRHERFSVSAKAVPAIRAKTDADGKTVSLYNMEKVSGALPGLMQAIERNPALGRFRIFFDDKMKEGEAGFLDHARELIVVNPKATDEEQAARINAEIEHAVANIKRGGETITREQTQEEDAAAAIETGKESVRFSIGEKRKEQMRQGLRTKLTNATDEKVEATIAAIEEMGERVKAGGDPKTEKVAFHWAKEGTIILPEDEAKVLQAIKVAEKAKVDPTQYRSPMELINAHADIKIKDPRIDPDTVPQFTNKKTLPHGITIYDVEDTREGQAAMRRIINTHYGEEASPWCLLQGDGKGGLMQEAWGYWNNYNAVQKRVAFKNGKLHAFCASADGVTWWDRQDKPHLRGIPVTREMPNDELGRSATYEMNEVTGEFSNPTNIYKGNKQNGTYEVWFDNGQVESREHYKNGKKDGICEEFRSNGQPLYFTTYKNGVPNGEALSWHYNGKLKSRENWKDGKKEGLRETWHSNGKRYERENWKDGNYEGLVEEWRPNGMLWKRANFKQGWMHGICETWDENGELSQRDRYENGSFVEVLPRDTQGESRFAVSPTPRTAKTTSEAYALLVGSGAINKQLNNDKLGMNVVITKRCATEMKNANAVKKSISPRLHAQAVANADSLFENAYREITHADTHGRTEVLRTHRLATLMRDTETQKVVPVMLTIVEYKQYGNKYYTLEVVNPELYKTNSAGLMTDSSQGEDARVPIAEFVLSIAKDADECNARNSSFSVADHSAPATTAPAEQLPRARSGWARETPRRRTANERYAVTNRDIPNMNGQELVTLAIAAQVAMQRHKNGVNPRNPDGTLREVAKIDTIKRMLRKYYPNMPERELRILNGHVMWDAKKMAESIMKEMDEAASDAEILNALSAEMQTRYKKRIHEATLKGEMVKGLSARAQEELNRKQEATIAAAVAVETGLDANAVENEYGIDLAETMVGLSDTAEFIKSRNAQMMIAEMSAADQEDGETGKDGETAGETDGATDTGNEKKLTPEEEAKRKQEEEERKKKINERFEQQAKDADKQRKEAKKEAEKRKAEAAAAGETDGATEDGEEGEEDAEGASKPLTPEEAAAREKAREEERQRVREACKELIARAEARAKERKEKLEAANKKRAEAIAKKKAEAAAAGETAGETESEGTNAEDESEDGGDAGETNGALDAIELAKVAIDLANPEHVAAFIIELARAKWIAQHNLKKDITDGQLWRDKIALQFLRKTAESIMTKMARSMNHSYGREMSMSEIAKITHAPNFSGVRSRIENAARVIRDRMITDKRKKLVKTVENFIRKNYIRHKEFKNGEEYTKRKCAAETELFMRDVLKVMWYSNAKVEKELERIEIENAELKGEYANGGRDKDQSKAYNRNERMRRALLQYGALIRRTPGEIMDAFTIIQDVKETDDTQKRIEERERRTQAAADILSAYFTNPEMSHVFTDSEHRIGNYFCGHMGLMDRLRDMGRYCKDAKTEEQAKAVLEYLDFMIQRSGDESASERRRHSDAFYKAVERIYHRKYRTVMAEMNTPDARFDKFGIIDDEAGGANKMTKGRAMQLYVSLMQNGEREYKHNIELHKREGQADEIRALLTAEDLQMIKWLGNWYEQNRKQLSAITYDLFGTKVESESANYFPVKMFLEMQGMEKPNVSVFQLFPKSLMPRIRNSRDFDTTADIFQMWMSRMTENAEWKAHAQLGLEVRGIFGRAKLCETIRRNHGRTALAQTQAFMNDILLGKTQSDESGAGVNTFGDEVRGYAALLALGGNVGVTLKQTTSIPAFGFEKGNRELFLQHEGDGADG